MPTNILLASEKERRIEHRPMVWVPGSVLDYESLWLISRYLVILNGLTKAEFIHDFCVRNHIGKHSIAWNTTGTDASGRLVRLTSLSRRLGEKIERFEYSYIWPVKNWDRDLFAPHLRFCTVCLRNGYHTVLFSLKALDRCPIHHIELWDRCVCGRQIDHSLYPELFKSPEECPCGYVTLFDKNMASFPRLDPGLLRAFDEIAVWVNNYAPRVYAPHTLLARKSGAEPWLRNHFQYWSKTQRLVLPPIIFPLDGSIFTLEPRAGEIHICGVKEPTDVVFKSEPVNINIVPAIRIYKGVVRYIKKNYLYKKNIWTLRFSQHCDADYIHKVISTNELALWSYALMLFRMHVQGEDYLSRLHDEKYNRNRRLQYYFPVPMIINPSYLGHRESAWLAEHVTGAMLWDAWDACVSAVRQMAQKDDVCWGSQSVQLTKNVHWSAIRGEDHFLRLRIDRARYPTLNALFKQGHKKSQEARREEEYQRQQAYFSLCERPCLIADETEGWIMKKKGAIPEVKTDPSWLKRHRLILPGTKIHYILFPYQDGYVARSLEPPIETYEKSTTMAIHRLRELIRFYKRVIH